MLFLLIGLTLGLIGLGISLIVHFGYRVGNNNRVGHWYIDALPGTIVGLVIGVIVLSVLSLSVSLSTIGKARDLETFYMDNHGLFLESVVDIREGVRDSGMEGRGFLFYDAARKDHITIYNGQVQEYKQNVLHYNRDLRRHKYWQNHPFLGKIYADVAPETRSLPTLNLPRNEQGFTVRE